MATKKHELTDLEISITSQLIDIQQITMLCAFASEARRILNDISVANESNSEVGELLGRLTTAHNEWIGHEDNLGVVLKNVRHQLQAVIDQVATIGSAT